MHPERKYGRNVTDGGSSIPAVQRLLAALAASKPDGRFAETGTAFCAGSRAIIEAMGSGATFVTVEVDRERYEHARAALREARVEVVHGRWEDILPARAPFDLIFLDAGSHEDRAVEFAVSLLAPGGILVKDDLTPGRAIAGDPIREVLLRHPRLISVEILTTPHAAAILAVRRA